MSDPSDNESEEYFSEEEESVSEEAARVPKHQKNLVVEREPNDLTCTTYIFNNEDHTLGNALRVLLSTDEDVEFVGYSIPHPSETKMNLRVQTTGEDTNKVLNLGLRNIQSICKTVKTHFLKALAK